MSIAEIIVAILVIIATIFCLATPISLWRSPDALTRVNLLGTTICCAIPLLIIAKLIRDWSLSGFDPNDFVRAIIAIAGVWVIGSVGSFYIGRAIHAVEVTDRSTGEDSEEDGTTPSRW